MMFFLSRSLLESQEEQILCVVSRLPSKKRGKAKSVSLGLGLDMKTIHPLLTSASMSLRMAAILK